MIIGIDTGGTFTDVVVVHEGGIGQFKIPSTPRDPSVAFRQALEKAAELHPGETAAAIIYGSTIATNTLLEGKLARSCFVTNVGFEDIFRLGRQNRSGEDLYKAVPRNRTVAVPREMVVGFNARQYADGSVEGEPTTRDIADLIVCLDDLDPASVAIGFLHSYVNPRVEGMVAGDLKRAGFEVCISSEIDPNPYEYERFTTTAINAGLIPVLKPHLGKLAAIAGTEPLLMQSNGGVIRACDAADKPVNLLLSGPAGGVMGLDLLAGWIAEEKLIGYDMGGTSTDVAVYDGSPPMRQELELAGLPVRCPSLDINTVGAGGGSIVEIGRGGALKVGPQSAGAEPGPACYGRGGPLTLTDCNLLTGRLPRGILLAGTLALDAAASEAALNKAAGDVMQPRGLAEGALKVAAAVMAGAVRKAVRDRGADPSEFALVAFGGAGGLHAVDLAMEVGIGRIIFPREAGVFSALGMALSRPRRDKLHHIGLRWERGTEGENICIKVKSLAIKVDEDGEVALAARCRYPGQRFFIEIPFGPDLPERFDDEHRRRFGLARPEAPVEVVTVVASILGAKPDISPAKHTPVKADYPSPSGAVAWSELEVGARVEGPAAVVGRDASAWIPRGHAASVDDMGNLRMEVAG